MTVKLHDALTEALDSLKEGGLIRKYSLVWSGRSEAPLSYGRKLVTA